MLNIGSVSVSLPYLVFDPSRRTLSGGRVRSHFFDQRLVIWVRAIFVRAWKMVSVSVRYLFYQPMNEKIKTRTLRFPAKESPNMEKALFDEPIVLQYDFKANYRLISRKFSSMKFFQPSVRLTDQTPARLYPFDKPIKSLYFLSFFVSVLFARFHFKVIRKSL